MSDSDKRGRNRRWALWTGGLLLLGAGAAVAAYFLFFQKQGNLTNARAPFEAPKPVPKPRKRAAESFQWPIYGYTPQRTRYLDANIKPPFKKLWLFGKGSLIEFQPVLANGFLYVVENSGMAYRINARSGKVMWQRRVGSLNASSPAWYHDRLYVATLSGAITCLDGRSGKVLWKKPLPSRSESSPIVIKGVVYFGSENGTVFALRADNGGKVWTYHAGGAVKAGLAYDKGMLFFGDYAGAVTALRARDGSKVWSAGTSGGAFNTSGNFYSTPAVAFGRVYLGNTDSFVYSFVAKDGQLAWRHGTGGYVYAAPAVADIPHFGPTVYIGSYDGRFYALDARSGSERWSYAAGGRISGAPTIVGDIVYFSNLGDKTTDGLAVRSGRRVWKFGHGAFNPVISDGKRLYVTGYSSEYGLLPH
ncbi:MAG: hypothetical protein QOE06_118 [Thermoleophilaceae bacterium]|nr:hypothetical protein [Thermoleophilaceae bacterium]